MAKYCPSCGNESADVINYCWNCGQYLGRGKVSELESKESSQKVKEELGLEDRSSVPETDQYVKKKETSLAIFTVYGVTKGELEELLDRHNLKVDYLPTPGVCKSNEAVSQYELETQKTERSKSGQSGGAYGSSYYYNDPTAEMCCYYSCMPRPYACSSGYGSGYGRGSRSSSCDDDNDSDGFGALVVILIVIALIGLIIMASPAIIAAGLVILDLAIAIALLLFNTVTLGIFKDDLSRIRIRIKEATTKDINNFTYDLASHKGVPKIPGYWTVGYSFIRYGALFFIAGIILTLVTLVSQPESKTYYYIPVVITVVSIIAFMFGHFLINRKVEEIKSMLS